jgi:tubulin-specific chaperone D
VQLLCRAHSVYELTRDNIRLYMHCSNITATAAAAAAAILHIHVGDQQENVGRQGHENMAHGIEILTAADYFSLGSRTAAYLTIAPYVASFAPHRAALTDHVAAVKLQHWDSEVRALAAKALGALAPLDLHRAATELLPTVLQQILSPDLLKRHGACLAAGELLLAIANSSSSSDSSSAGDAPLLTSETTSAVLEAIPALEKARLYRGRGGEVMRTAACKLAQCIAAALPLTAKARARLLDTADECLKHPSEEVQSAAAGAAQALLRSAFRGPAIVSQRTDASVSSLIFKH